MFGALAAIVAFFVVLFTTITEDAHIFESSDPNIRQFKYEYNAHKQALKEEYERSKLPKSGYMLTEDYEKESLGIDNETRVVEARKYPKPSNMKYVPQPTYKLARYNNPPGTPELNIPRKLNFDRQINMQGIVSGDFTKLVYPSVYYYAKQNCTACDVFVIPLDTNLNRVERVQKANVIKKNPQPIFSTIKDISQEGAFRTITPVDFSEDNRYIVAKEKTGYVHDGIWKTELLVHDFETGKSLKLKEARETILEYWHNVTGVEFSDYRWDIYPLGFDKNDNSKILITGYAYTGNAPIFLGTWGVNVDGSRTELIDPEGSNYSVSIVGYKLVHDSYISREQVEWEAKRQDKLEKNAKRKAKAEKRNADKAKRQQYNLKKKQLREKYRKQIKAYKAHNKSGKTSYDGEILDVGE